MLEREHIQHRGFRNIIDNGKIIGFQVAIRQVNYRGAWLSQIRILGITVDKQEYDLKKVRVEINGIEYTTESLKEHGRIMWPLSQTALLKVYTEGGLSQGEHEVSVFSKIIKSYLPPRFDTLQSFEKTKSNTRKLLIV